MNAQHYVAFDFGAESGRAILATLERGQLKLEEKHRFPNPNGRMNGQLQWNLLGQWEQIKTGLRAATADGSIEISGIGVDTWGVDFGLLARDGTVLGNPCTYRDGRTDGVMDEVFRIVPREEVFAQTGIQFMQFNTLFQLFALERSKSPMLELADKLLFMPDLFHYLLTGRAANEFSIASTSQMFDPRRKTWASSLLERLGLPTHLLGEIVPSGTVLGPLKEEVAKELDVRAMPVITPGSHDTASAVAAVPAEGGSWCYISSGTWSLMGVELDEPLINAKSARYNYTNEGGVGGKIRFLKNIMGLWLVQECRRAFVAGGHDHSYGDLTQMAARSEPFRSLVDPDHPPMLKPGAMPAKIEAFCEQTSQAKPSTRGEVVRTCLDSLALTYRRTLEGLEDILGRRIDVIHIVGGGTQNELLNQMTADACGRPVVTGPVEATAIGNVLAQAIATGQVADLAAARRIVRESFSLKRYEPRDTAAAERAYQRFRNICGE